MKRSIYVILALLITQSVFATDIQSLVITIPNTYSTFTTSKGADGRIVVHPSDWTTSEGRDGRKVAWPATWVAFDGRDGRKVAYPATWLAFDGRDGRKVAISPSWKTVQGDDGRIVGVPGSSDSELQLIYDNVTQLGLLFELSESSINREDLMNYALYQYLNSE